MTRNAYTELSSLSHLSESWREMYKASKPKKRDGFGLDQISLNQFKADENYNLKKVSGLLRSGCYEPQLLLPHFIPKPCGKDRLISVPAVVDRLIQRALLRLLEKKGYGFQNNINYGFVKGRSVKEAAQKAIALRTEKPWVYKADISSFFDTISREKLIAKVRKKIRTRSLHPLIEAIIHCEVNCRHSGIEKRISKLGINKGTGIRQGMPASPYLANVMLADFDQKIEKHNISIIRYADDIIAFANSKSECENIHKLCESLLNDEDLKIHPLGESSKTVIAAPHESVEFLGLELVKRKSRYELAVSELQLDSISNKIFAFSDLDYCIKNKITLSKLLRKIEDTINGYLGVYDLCFNHEQLQQKMASAKSKTLSYLFTKRFGIKYEELTKNQKIFLEIE